MKKLDFVDNAGILAIVAIVVFSVILGVLMSSLSVERKILINSNNQPTMPTSSPPVFTWPTIDPEFIRCGDIVLSYEFISEGRHLVSVEDNGNGYIMPLFETREEAIDFMDNYFDFLKIYYGGRE